MSIHRTIDELAREAATVTREAAERRAVPSADVEGFAARLRARRTLRVVAVGAAIALGVIVAGTLTNELRDGPNVPVISDVADREQVDDDEGIVENADPYGQVMDDELVRDRFILDEDWEHLTVTRHTHPDISVSRVNVEFGSRASRLAPPGPCSGRLFRSGEAHVGLWLLGRLGGKMS